MSDYETFLNSRSRDWWRGYYTESKSRAERMLKRPMTLGEKKLMVRAIRHLRKTEMLASTGTTGMFVAFAIQQPDEWLPIVFAEDVVVIRKNDV